MARAAKKTARGGAKAQARSAPAKRGARKAGAATKRAAAKGRSRQQSGAVGSWFDALSTLSGSTLGLQIMAEVLEAAAAAIRNRPQMVSEMVEAGVGMATDTATTTEEAVQQATRVLSEAASALSPRALLSAEESQLRRRRGRSGRKAASKKGREPG
jgi:hypothetical protein